MQRFPGSFALVASCFAFTASDAAQSQVTALGGEFQVNLYTLSAQTSPSLGMDSEGDFVVVWQSYGQDGSSWGVFARRFDSSGASLGAQFQVNSYTPNSQALPVVGMESNGDFVVAWQSQLQDGSIYGVFARRFNSGGQGVAAEFQVNTYTTNGQRVAAVGMDADGDFVVAWHSNTQDGSTYGVFARRFDSSGAPLGADFQVNVYTSSSQTVPALSMEPDGDFVVAWGSSDQDGSGSGVFARRFNSAGQGLGAEFQVNASTANEQLDPALDVGADGNFVVAWQSSDFGANVNVVARRFNAAGASLGGEFLVNSLDLIDQGSPAVGRATDGSFVIAWHSVGQDGSEYGVFARSFDAAGVRLASEFQVNSHTQSLQGNPGLGMNGEGDFVLAWNSNLQDGSEWGIFAQRYATFAVLDIDGNGSTGALTDGLLVLRYLFGFTGATLVTGAVDVVDCTRCSAPAIEGYLQTLI